MGAVHRVPQYQITYSHTVKIKMNDPSYNSDNQSPFSLQSVLSIVETTNTCTLEN